MTQEDTKRILVGEWVSLTPEVRPSATRNPGGTLKAFYLRDGATLGHDPSAAAAREEVKRFLGR